MQYTSGSYATILILRNSYAFTMGKIQKKKKIIMEHTYDTIGTNYFSKEKQHHHRDMNSEQWKSRFFFFQKLNKLSCVHSLMWFLSNSLRFWCVIVVYFSYLPQTVMFFPWFRCVLVRPFISIVIMSEEKQRTATLYEIIINVTVTMLRLF